jgi:hypothetical protein
MAMKKLCILAVSLFLLTGCATTPVTSFQGKSKVEGGPSGCETKCEEWGMELVGMIALGEYSDGCICRKKDEKLSMYDVGETFILASAGSGAAPPAVMADMRARAAAGTPAPLMIRGFPMFF